MNLKRLFRLFMGIFLYAVGIVLSVQANIGVAPWDAFHQGLAGITSMTFGQASIVVGLVILIINYTMDIKIGFGTIVNAVGIGYIIDIFMYNDIIPVSTNPIISVLMIIGGMFLIAFASYFYIGAGLGAGPRDGLMVGLVKKTNKRVGVVRSSIELTVLLIGFILGGQIGIGTLLLAIGIGPIMQFTFKWLSFTVEDVKHDYLLSKEV